MARVLVMSSQVVRGAVGAGMTVPALQSFGHEVWALPTIILSTRPGLGTVVPLAPPLETLTAMLAALETDGCFERLDGIVTGYLPNAAMVALAAETARRIKLRRPDCVYLCDPVLGDAGRLYLAESVATAIRDDLLGLADIATPNRFELEWCSASACTTRDQIIAAATGLAPANVVVSSAIETSQEIETLLVCNAPDATVTRHVGRRFAAMPNGTGDALAGLLLGAVLDRPTENRPVSERTTRVFASVMQRMDEIARASAGREVIDITALLLPSSTDIATR